MLNVYYMPDGPRCLKINVLYFEMGTSSSLVNLTHCDLMKSYGDTERDLCQH